MRRAAKVDRNQNDVVQALEAIGATVTLLSQVGEGCPDLLVGFRGANHLIEVKDGELAPSARKLTPPQKKWHAGWRGKAHVANSVADAIAIVTAK